MTYRVRVLEVIEGPLTAGAATPAALEGEHSFGAGNLFIDDVQPPVHVPVNVCGNTREPASGLNPAYGNTCVND
ncbi:MAG: chaplin [Chloroflexota bacterium]|nr:chaplin [Chloroflexota bacterium]